MGWWANPTLASHHTSTTMGELLVDHCYADLARRLCGAYFELPEALRKGAAGQVTGSTGCPVFLKVHQLELKV